MAKIVIIGAGLTGLSAAYHLERKGFFDYKLFEKETEPGGLCRSLKKDGFTFDYTGHLLHINDPYFQTFVEDLVGLETFNRIERRSFIYSHATYTPYPYQINLHGLPTQTIIDCIEGFVTRTQTEKKDATFPEWVHARFGSGFAKHFFTPYQSKIFAYDITKISASWTGRFVPSTSLRQIIRGAIHQTQNRKIGYNANFFYPKNGGIASWVNTLAETLQNSIQTDFCVKKVDCANKIVSFTNGHIEPFELLITTMPLDILLDSLQEKSSTYLKCAKNKLLCNSVINFNLGIKKANLSTKHWIYFPEKKYAFYRLGFPHNFATSMAPKNCSSVYGEFAHIKKTESWVTTTLKASIKATKKLLGLVDSDIITEKIVTIPHAYVIYDFWREKQLPRLLKKLEQNSIYSIGRYGAWKYSSMQEAILDGKTIAERLIVVPAKQYFSIGTPIIKEKKEKENEL